MTRVLVLYVLLLAIVVGCASQGDERFNQKAEAEGRAAAKAEREALDQRAREMEADLHRRQKFYSAAQGTYEGSFVVDDIEYATRLKLIPSLPLYKADRVRAIDEIINDLNGLSFHVQVVYWVKADGFSNIGCVFQGVKPDFDKGIVNAVSQECPHLYSINVLGPLANEFTPMALKDESMLTIKKIFEGDITSLEQMYVHVQTKNNNKAYNFLLKKTQ